MFPHGTVQAKKKKLVKSNESIPFFAISKIAKNLFLKWEKTPNNILQVLFYVVGDKVVSKWERSCSIVDKTIGAYFFIQTRCI